MQAIKRQPGHGLQTQLLAGGQSGVHTQGRQGATWLGDELYTHQSNLLHCEAIRKIRKDKDIALVTLPLHPRQYGPVTEKVKKYQKGTSMETALAQVVIEIEKGMTDTDESFNYTTVDSICVGACVHAVPDTGVNQMQRLLSSRVIEADQKHHMLRAWVVDQLFRELSKVGIFSRAYSDYIITTCSVDDKEMLFSLMRFALGILKKWCKKVKLSVNSQ